jgi:arginine decarboxylase
MLDSLPRRFFLTSGHGDASTELNAFDAALLKAGIGDTNLIRMSSILPPAAERTEVIELPRGSFVPLAYGEICSSVPGTRISAAVAVGIPANPTLAGLIMECSGEGAPETYEEAARAMVSEGMEEIRRAQLREILSISVTHKVERCGAAFAAVVLCP